MRLTEKERQVIKETIYKYFGENLKIFLFGSRVDDSKKGGDIDLYVLQNSKKDTTYQRLLTKAKLQEQLYKPVDLIISKTTPSQIDREGLNGIEL